MKLYHASTLCIKKPDVLHSRDKLDFGRGFYMTSIREQAIRYAERFTRRGKEAFINEYCGGYYERRGSWAIEIREAKSPNLYSQWADD